MWIKIILVLKKEEITFEIAIIVSKEATDVHLTGFILGSGSGW